jgi:chromosome segregation ATPase
MEPENVYTHATRSLDKAADMADELEYKVQYFLQQLERTENTKHELQTEVNELNDAIDSLYEENTQLEQDNRDARRSFTGLQIAVSVLVFAYGLFYGAYLRC